MAPRALKDSVRPRRLSGVVVRPLNFTVRWPLQRRHYYAVAIFTMVFLVLFLFAASPASPTVRAVSVIVGLIGFPVVFYLWCKSDALYRNVTPPPGALPLGAMVWPLAWLYYVVLTYPFGRAIGRIMLVVAMTVAIVVAGAILGHIAGASAT